MTPTNLQESERDFVPSPSPTRELDMGLLALRGISASPEIVANQRSHVEMPEMTFDAVRDQRDIKLLNKQYQQILEIMSRNFHQISRRIF